MELSRRTALKKRPVVASPLAFPVSQFPPSAAPSPAKYIPPLSVNNSTGNFASQLQRQQEMQQQFLQSQLQQHQQMQNKTSMKGPSANPQNPLAFPSSPHPHPSTTSNSSVITGMGLGAMPSLVGAIPVAAAPPPQQLQQLQSQAGPIRKNSIKTRRDALAGQLPLKAGRQVAFRQPKKDSGIKEEWILARIENCIGTDKNRFVFVTSYLETCGTEIVN